MLAIEPTVSTVVPITTETPTARWSPLTRVAFRFFVLYFGMYVLMTQMLNALFVLPIGTVPRLDRTGPATGVVPADPDPRLIADRVFVPIPKTHGQRVDSTVRALVFAYNDSVAKAAEAAGRKPGDWTFERGGQKWGLDGNKIYLGKFAIPSAVLAALPIRVQGNPGETMSDRLVTTRRGEVLEHAASQYHDMEFKSAVKRIRERKDRERREKLASDGKTVAGTEN